MSKIKMIKEIAGYFGRPKRKILLYQPNITELYYDGKENTVKLEEGMYTIKTSISERINRLGIDYRIPERKAMKLVTEKEMQSNEENGNELLYIMAVNDWINKSLTWRLKYKELLTEVINIIIQLVEDNLSTDLEDYDDIIKDVLDIEKSEKLNEHFIKGMLDSATVTAYFHKVNLEERILFAISFPKLLDQTYYLYKLHEYPIPRRFDEGAIIIKARERNLIISESKEWYALVNDEKLNSCTENDEYKICKVAYALFSTEESTKCEIKLFMGNNNNLFNDCTIANQQIYVSQWIPLSHEKGWFYSLSEEEQIQIRERNKENEFQYISGIGIIHSKKACRISSRTVMILVSPRGNRHLSPQGRQEDPM